MFLISAIWKLSKKNLKPQESEDLKVVYGLKFFYLAKEENPFFTQWYANGIDAVVCGHENSNVHRDHYATCFRKHNHHGNEEWIHCPALWQQWAHEHCFYNCFFSLKVRICTIKVFRFFLAKMTFCQMKTLFYDRLFVLI